MKNKLSKSEKKFIKLSLHDISKYLLQLCVLTSIYVIQEMKKRIDIVKQENNLLQKQVEDLKMGKGWVE